MKRIFLLSTMMISSFVMMNVQTISAAPVQQAGTVTVAIGAKAKQLVSKINTAVSLRDNQFSKVNDACIEYFQQLETLNNAKPADLSTKVAALKATRDAKIKASLATDQLKAWAAFKE